VVDIAEDFSVQMFLNLVDNRQRHFKSIDTEGLFIKDHELLNRVIDRLVETKVKNPHLIQNSFTSLDYARRYFKDLGMGDIPCYQGMFSIFADPYGNIYSGCWALPPLGDIRKKTLKSILSSPEYKKRLIDMVHKRCPGCACGYIINLYHHPPAVFKEAIKRTFGSIKRQMS